MPQFRDTKIFLTVFTVIPILLIIANQIILTSIIKAAETTSFQIWLILISSYLILRRGNYILKIKWISIQIIIELSLLGMPFAYPIYLIFTQANPIEFEGVCLAYLILALLFSIYLLVRRKSLGGVAKIGTFLFAYIFALMIYAGSLAGHQIDVPFLVTAAFDQLFRVAILTGYHTYLVSPSSEVYVRISMILAIPAIIFLSLSAELAKSEENDISKKSTTNIISDLKPVLILLTFASVLVLALTLPLSLWLETSNRQFVTLIPTLGLATFAMLLIIISERRENKIR